MRIPLLAGPYQSRSVIASSQRSINLFPESNEGDPQAPAPVTQYPTPGLSPFSQSTTVRVVRQLYRATNGALYAVIGPNVYAISNTGTQTLLGTITDLPTTVYFADNGLAIVLVDGMSTGYAINMVTNAFAPIIDPSFLGADFVIYFDTFFIFNQPDTNKFYISLSFADYTMLTAGTAFDPLDIAGKTGSADNIVGIVASQPYFIIVGALTSELWQNTGAADFTFGRVAGTFINHGCIAPYSINSQDIVAFWLSQDLQGNSIIIRCAGSEAKRVSTHAIEADITSYTIKSDAIGFCYQQQGHSFYILTFPSANKTWVYELATEQWHERNWIDQNGVLKRHRANCCAYAYDLNIVGDWQNGKTYVLNPNVYTDDGNPIPRIRTYPHLLQDGDRVIYHQFIVDIQTGTYEAPEPTSGDWNSDFNDDFSIVPGDTAQLPILNLRWSDDRGVSYGNPVQQSFGKTGEYLTQVSYWRLGMARDRVFEVSWSLPVRTALNGAWVETKKART